MRLRQQSRSLHQELLRDLGRMETPAAAIGSNLSQRVGPELACETLLKVLEDEWARARRQRVPKTLLLLVLGLSMFALCLFWPIGFYLLWQARPNAPPSRRWCKALVALRPFLLDSRSPLSLELRISLWEESRNANVESLRAELVQTITVLLLRLSGEEASHLSPQARRFLCKGIQQFQKRGTQSMFGTEFVLSALLTLADTPPSPELDLPKDLIQHLRAHYVDRRIYEAMEVYLDSRAGAHR